MGKTRLVRIAEEVVKEVEKAAKPTKTPIGFYFELAAKEKIKKTKEVTEVEQFRHGVDEEKARKYLKEIGVYDRCVEVSPVGDQGFIMIIAANIEWDKRNKKDNK